MSPAGDFEFDFDQTSTEHGSGAAPLSGTFTFLDLDAGTHGQSLELVMPSATPWSEGGGEQMRVQARGNLTAPGTRFGPFEVTDRLGQGAMSVVLRAKNSETGEEVAIKVLADRLAKQETVRERFRREAIAVSRMRHPNVMRVHTFGIAQDRPFMVLELLEQGSVAELLEQRGALPLRQAIEIGLGTLDGLQVAHELGFLHRDLKPDNLMLDREGRVKIVDFGLVRWLGDDDNPLTAAGARLGTPFYMAPEQIEGGAVDERTDLYALGATLYELLAGAVPFAGQNMMELTELQYEGAPPLRRRRPEVTAPLEQVVQRLLAYAPDDRFQSAAEAREALRAVRPKARTYRVELRCGAEAGAWEMREGEALVIGRSSKSAAFPIPDRQLSRAHCELRATDKGLVVADLGSTNGTFHAGRQISRPTPLQASDVVEIGDSRVQVSWQ